MIKMNVKPIYFILFCLFLSPTQPVFSGELKESISAMLDKTYGYFDKKTYITMQFDYDTYDPKNFYVQNALGEFLKNYHLNFPDYSQEFQVNTGIEYALNTIRFKINHNSKANDTIYDKLEEFYLAGKLKAVISIIPTEDYNPLINLHGVDACDVGSFLIYSGDGDLLFLSYIIDC